MAAGKPIIIFNEDCDNLMNRRWHADEYAAWGDRMYAQGASGAYFFNLFCELVAKPGLGVYDAWNLVVRDGFTPDSWPATRSPFPRMRLASASGADGVETFPGLSAKNRSCEDRSAGP